MNALVLANAPTLEELAQEHSRNISMDKGPYFATPQLRQVLCLRGNGKDRFVLFVSEDHLARTDVSEYRHRLRVARLQVNVVHATLEDIKNLYAAADTAAEPRSRLEEPQRAMLELLRAASKLKASDIHIRVGRAKTVVRFRVNGRITTVSSITREEGAAMVATLYNTMTTEQEGTFDLKKDQNAQLREEFMTACGLAGSRVATRPSKGPEGILMVIRLNYPSSGAETLEGLGYLPTVQLPQIRYMFERTHGLVLVSGVTGSGKTKTLATAVTEICADANQEIHFITVEDPTEIDMLGDGVTQTPLIYDRDDPEAQNRAWAMSNKSILRLDPDNIMLGELRDTTSALGALEGTLTGHLVLGTLHTPDTHTVIDRLRNMGLPDDFVFNAAQMIGVINQSLVAILCDACKMPLAEAPDGTLTPTLIARLRRVLPDLEGIHVRPPVATKCRECNSTHHSGRALVAEVLTPDATYMEIFRAKGMAAAKRHWVVKMGGVTKLSHALVRVREGSLDPRDAQDILGPLDLDLITIGADARPVNTRVTANLGWTPGEAIRASSGFIRGDTRRYQALPRTRYR